MTSICIVIQDLTKLSQASRLFAYAKEQAWNGKSVTILAARPGGAVEAGEWKIVILPAASQVKSDNNLLPQISYELYHWLKVQPWDEVHSLDGEGLAYYSLLAREQGLAFNGTRFVLHDNHVPAPVAPDYAILEREFMAQCCREMADRGKPPTRVRSSQAMPLVSVCVAHYKRPQLLQRVVDSLEQQDYPNFELIIVDDGSDDMDTPACLNLLERRFAPRGWKIIRQENRYLGAARNTAARAAQGEYLLFMDDDNIALPQEISTFVHAAQEGGADILTCAMQRFDEEPDKPTLVHIPLGPCLPAAFFENCFGDANALVKREVFEALGGFSEEVGVGLEDMEFFCKAALAGYHLQVVPETLFMYRDSAGSMIQSTKRLQNGLRAIRPLQAAFPELHDVIAVAHRAHIDAHALIKAVKELEELHHRASKEWEHRLAVMDKDLTLLRMDYDKLNEEKNRYKLELDGLRVVTSGAGTEVLEVVRLLRSRGITRVLVDQVSILLLKIRDRLRALRDRKV